MWLYTVLSLAPLVSCTVTNVLYRYQCVHLSFSNFFSRVMYGYKCHVLLSFVPLSLTLSSWHVICHVLSLPIEVALIHLATRNNNNNNNNSSICFLSLFSRVMYCYKCPVPLPIVPLSLIVSLFLLSSHVRLQMSYIVTNCSSISCAIVTNWGCNNSFRYT